MSMSSVQISDYEDANGKTLYNNKGPIAACCNRPYRQCDCEKPAEIPGENTRLEPAAIRQATALEMIAVELHNLRKILDQNTPRVVTAAELEANAIISVPGSTTLDASTLAANEARKAALIAKTKEIKS